MVRVQTGLGQKVERWSEYRLDLEGREVVRVQTGLRR